MDYKRDEKIILPTAPKAARGPDVDLSKVPNRPPYTVYLGNLPYDVCDEDVIKFFRGLKVSSVRLPRESGDRGRMRGFGYAEFPDRSTLLEALGYNNENLKSRSIKVSLAEEHDNEGRERGNRDIGRSDRSLGGDWRAMSRDDGDDDRRESSSFGGSRGYDDDGGYRRPGFGRDSDRDGGDFGRDRFSRDRPRGFGDRDQGFDRGFERRGGGLGGYDRPRDRDYDRDRGFGGGGRREYGSSFRDDRDDRFSRDDRDDRDQDSAPRERKKLQLKPRSVPVEATKEAAAVPKAPEPAPKASSAIFGGARPVDTAAREREIEARLARQREEEERRQIRDREPFQDSRKDDRVRRSSVGSGSGRSRRSSESGRDSYDDGGRQPLSRQYSNVLSNYCLSCRRHKALEDVEEEIWQAFHTPVCEKNTTCSAHAMETEAAVKIWKRTGLYTTPLQDGASSHKFCPDGDMSWCKNKRAQALGVPALPHTPILTPSQGKPMLPVYKRLTEEKLLQRCVKGQMQNAAESLNSKIWLLCPKTKFATRTVVETATAIAVLWLNQGRISSMTAKVAAEARAHRRSAAKKARLEEAARRDCEGPTYGAGTVINTLKVAGTVLKLAMMHLYESTGWLEQRIRILRE
ncbi:hypothetical protein HPB52_023982 [Rhipicephalus sanguineus]|uniref:RRM domain-containing protein n=1 Tax=Rhipicephalus sanguineus TaxID=34632 RepID=A0A9D4PT06_RHISA|nr:hypothetical protein HPB52_023982 [Rhipicephalus sanguineus]